ncbi:GNAT family N-acetyltransferase [Micromonospora sp. C31]|uniref:GNAT family N-acetyltransferase n=1 Tax=Micromonospora sp. C31 TaxID=2824876 RepID=UPI001B3906CE|nr:GNAT family N-acetyltransferase [Micromonospora sp. C31]MBQ1073206.1 GNAT family N-acetyltransferase [Micromonospora sp. C31]
MPDALTRTAVDGSPHTVSELMTAWGRGWAVSRGTPAPVAIPGGFRVDVGLPGHRVRHVLHTYDADTLGRLGRASTAPGTWIKISGARAGLRAALPEAWTLDSAGHLMSAPLTPGAVEPPAPYATRVVAEGGVVVATVLDAAGRGVASGRLAGAGEFGVVDQVETEPAHRRRGLGVVVMRALCDYAARRGARTGILVATDDGRALYRALGWTVRSEVSGAYLGEGPDHGEGPGPL